MRLEDALIAEIAHRMHVLNLSREKTSKELGWAHGKMSKLLTRTSAFKFRDVELIAKKLEMETSDLLMHAEFRVFSGNDNQYLPSGAVKLHTVFK